MTDLIYFCKISFTSRPTAPLFRTIRHFACSYFESRLGFTPFYRVHFLTVVFEHNRQSINFAIEVYPKLATFWSLSNLSLVHQKVRRRNSLIFSDHCIRTSEADLLIKDISQSISLSDMIYTTVLLCHICSSVLHGARSIKQTLNLRLLFQTYS